MTRPRKPPRSTVIAHHDAIADVAALATHGPEVVAVPVAITDDLAHGRVIGKEFGDRHVSGNLTGFARVKFDAPGQRPQPRRGTTPHALMPLDAHKQRVNSPSSLW